MGRRHEGWYSLRCSHSVPGTLGYMMGCDGMDSISGQSMYLCLVHAAVKYRALALAKKNHSNSGRFTYKLADSDSYKLNMPLIYRYTYVQHSTHIINVTYM